MRNHTIAGPEGMRHGPFGMDMAEVKSIQAALIPAINGMNVVGLVSIPGMMTGQILGGAPPMKAARYQIARRPEILAIEAVLFHSKSAEILGLGIDHRRFQWFASGIAPCRTEEIAYKVITFLISGCSFAALCMICARGLDVPISFS